MKKYLIVLICFFALGLIAQEKNYDEQLNTAFDNWDKNVLDDFDGNYNSLSNQPTTITAAQAALIASAIQTITGNESAFDNWDKNVLDDFDGNYNSLSNQPTTITAAQAALIASALQAEADGDTTNELPTFTQQNTEPTGAKVGDYWYDTDTKLLSRWNGLFWFQDYKEVSYITAATMSAADVNNPTDAEILIASNGTRDAYFRYTGTNVSSDENLFIYYVDIAGAVLKFRQKFEVGADFNVGFVDVVGNDSLEVGTLGRSNIDSILHVWNGDDWVDIQTRIRGFSYWSGNSVTQEFSANVPERFENRSMLNVANAFNSAIVAGDIVLNYNLNHSLNTRIECYASVFHAEITDRDVRVGFEKNGSRVMHAEVVTTLPANSVNMGLLWSIEGISDPGDSYAPTLEVGVTTDITVTDLKCSYSR